MIPPHAEYVVGGEGPESGHGRRMVDTGSVYGLRYLGGGRAVPREVLFAECGARTDKSPGSCSGAVPTPFCFPRKETIR